MEFERIVFSGHAVVRMFERSITDVDVRHVLDTGEVIVRYSEDKPFPSCIVLGYVGDRVIHVVAALDDKNRTCHVITVYEPELKRWQPDFRTRRK